ncbi:hypothetical protein [Solibacillus isronensis]|uniref:hypothetical protein n=1 Tax=Solibacillus isronensis TaxID=412383 RepID=UPI0039A3EB38
MLSLKETIVQIEEMFTKVNKTEKVIELEKYFNNVMGEDYNFSPQLKLSLDFILGRLNAIHMEECNR